MTSQNSINASDIRNDLKNLANSNGSKQKSAPVAHKDVLLGVLSALKPVHFHRLAEIEDGDKLPQKHLIVLCVAELLRVIREQQFDLARKQDFIFVYNGEFWRELDREAIKNFLGKAAAKLGVNSLEAQHYEFRDKLYKQFLSAAHLESVETNCKTVVINLLNGTFEVSAAAQKLRAFDKADFLVYQLPFEYDAGAIAPRFQNYLNSVLPEKELQDILAEFFGYVFTKNLKLEKALLLYGTGANGKSVLFDVINALLGRENVTNFSLSNLLEEHNRALIANKLLNYGSEINAGTTRDIFKNLVSTEPIQARLKYGQSFLMEKYAKLCFNCNELPKDIEQSRAYFRRLLIVPFRVTIAEDKQDKTLASKIIETELSGVFNWILDGLQRLLKNTGFTESEIIESQVEEYRKESDSVACYIADRGYEKDTQFYVSLKEFYFDYKAFCQEDGHQPLKKINVRRRLEALKVAVSSGNNDGVRVYLIK